MRLLDRYILTEMILPFLCGVGAVIMMLIGNTLFQLIDLILKNHIPVPVVARLIIFNIPALVVLTMPVGVALSSALAVSRLARDSEITVVRMSGVSLRRIFMPIFLLGLLASITSYVLSEQVVPWSQRAKARTEQAMFGYALAASPTLAANRVFVFQDYEFYIGSAESAPKLGKDVLLLHQITIIENPRGSARFPTIISAQSATYDNGLWSMKDVVVHQLDKSGFTSTEAAAPTMSLDLHNPLPIITDSSGAGASPDSFTSAELAQQIQTLTASKLDARDLQVAYYFKLSLPFLCFAFALCAPPLSLRWARNGPFLGVFLSIMMVFIGWNTLLLTKYLGIYGYLPPVAAAWAPDIIFAAVGLVMLRKAE